VRAAISTPTVSMLVMMSPTARNVSSTEDRTTLMSKHFSISVSPRPGPEAMTGAARKTWVYMFVSDGIAR